MHFPSLQAKIETVCVLFVAERATKKFTILIMVDITSLREEFEIFTQSFS